MLALEVLSFSLFIYSLIGLFLSGGFEASQWRASEALITRTQKMTTDWLLSFLLFLFWGLQHWLPWLRTPKQREQSEKPKTKVQQI